MLKRDAPDDNDAAIRDAKRAVLTVLEAACPAPVVGLQLKTVFSRGDAYLSVSRSTPPAIVTLIDRCVADIATERLVEFEPQIVVHGNKCFQRRNVGFVSDDTDGYTYSNTLMPAKRMTPAFRELTAFVNSVYAAAYNGVLINVYENEAKYISEHSDNEHGLDAAAGVVALSVGASRRFVVRAKGEKSKARDKILHEHLTGTYEFMQMAGPFQKFFTHAVPAEKRPVGQRISFTWRSHVGAQAPPHPLVN
jgi:alkylated DNA repair dioxygenase AlkB